MRLYVYEGTAEEIGELRRRLVVQGDPAAIVTSISEQPTEEFVGQDVAYRAITRIALSREQRSVLVAIYRAGEGGALASGLQRRIGYTASQFAGLMGAFGRRVSHTEGYMEHTSFFDQAWEGDEQCFRYRLPPAVRRALEQAELVR